MMNKQVVIRIEPTRVRVCFDCREPGALWLRPMFVNRTVLGLLAFLCLTACGQSDRTALSSATVGVGSNAPPTGRIPATTSTTFSVTVSTQTTTVTITSPTTTQTTAVTGTVPTETATEATPAPTLLFGLFNVAETFAASDDLDAAIVAIRIRYPAVAAATIAVPTETPAGTTVRFVGTLSWDGQPSVRTVVDVNGTQVFEASALPPEFVTCSPSPDAHWQTVTIRGDVDGCVSVSLPDGSQDGQWHEGSEAWSYRAEPAAGSPETWLTGLRLISPADTPFSLYTHCGVNGAMINGIWWKAVPVLSDRNGNPPPTWGNPSQNGGLHYTSDSTAVFTATSTTGAVLIAALHRTTSNGYPLICS